MQFTNRIEAGRLLAQKLAAYANRSDVIVLALPRGGVPVAYEVAMALHCGVGCIFGSEAGSART